MFGRKVLNTNEAKKLREDKLKNFTLKHHLALQQWFQEKGLQTTPPIMWDERAREWVWVGRT